jgi:chromosome segregation ATPase
MNIETFWTVLATLITVLGSSSVLKYFENKRKDKERKNNAASDDCRAKIIKLEIQIEKNNKEKEAMSLQILNLTAEVSKLSVRVEYLVKENNDLRIRMPKMRAHKIIKK